MSGNGIVTFNVNNANAESLKPPECTRIRILHIGGNEKIFTEAWKLAKLKVVFLSIPSAFCFMNWFSGSHSNSSGN